MFKTLTLAAAALGSTLALSAPVTAGSYATPATVKPTRILQLDSTICAHEREALIGWAANTYGYGAYAAPKFPASVTVACDSAVAQAVQPVGVSKGFSDQKSADLAAMNECKANLPDGFQRCVLIGRSYNQ